MIAKDLTGQKFGRLTVTAFSHRTKLVGTRRFWSCLCQCGRTTTVDGASLRGGVTKSCGCLRAEVTSARVKTHGKYGTTEHKIWAGILRRCTNPNEPAFYRYGGRGITVCDRWKSFVNFLEDMGHRPSEKHSIDRINNDGNYEPGNCRWATDDEQLNNYSGNRPLTARGMTLNIGQWPKVSGVGVITIRKRLKQGWDVESAIFHPVSNPGRSPLRCQ